MKSFLRVQNLAWACASALLCAAGCSKPPGPQVLARIGSHEITTADFQSEIEWRTANRRPLPGKGQLLEEMIAREVHLQKARAAGLEADPDLRRSYESLLIAKLEARDLMPRLEAVSVSAEDVRKVYEKEIARYTRPAKVRLALIRVQIQPGMTAEELAATESRLKEARVRTAALPAGTRGFGAVAVEYSDEPTSRYCGGDVGWYDCGRTEYRWPVEVMKAGFGLQQDGELSDIIKAADGYYLVARLEARDSVVTPLEHVQNAILGRLLAERRRQLEAQYARELRGFVPVQSWPGALADIPYPAPVLARAEENGPPDPQHSTTSNNGKSRAN